MENAGCIYLILLCLLLVHGCLSSFSSSCLLTQSFQSCLLLFFSQRLDLFGRFGKVRVITRISSISNLPRHVYMRPSSRLACVEFNLCHASKLLPTLVADHRSRDLTLLEGRWFDGGVGLVIFCRLRFCLDLLNCLVLVILEPLESPLNCG